MPVTMNTVALLRQAADAAAHQHASEIHVRHAVERICSRHYNRNEQAIVSRFQTIAEAAIILGGEPLQSFARCVDRLDELKAALHYDRAPLSIGWAADGIVGGLIAHGMGADCRWSLHT